MWNERWGIIFVVAGRNAYLKTLLLSTRKEWEMVLLSIRVLIILLWRFCLFIAWQNQNLAFQKWTAVRSSCKRLKLCSADTYKVRNLQDSGAFYCQKLLTVLCILTKCIHTQLIHNQANKMRDTCLLRSEGKHRWVIAAWPRSCGVSSPPLPFWQASWE